MKITLRSTAFIAALAGTIGLANFAVAQSPVVVVELFTSQGCSSCPPADDIFTDLAKQDDVIALGQHVDYWDYLGWKDNFAIHKFGIRQEYLNMNIPSKYRRVTPQMIFNGQSQVAGARASQINQKIKEIRSQKAVAEMQLTTKDNVISVNVREIRGRLKPSDIHLVHYIKEAVVPIKRGENSGRTVTYTNIVSSWETIGQWNGEGSATLSHRLTSDLPFAVVVQAQNYGPVYVAQRND